MKVEVFLSTLPARGATLVWEHWENLMGQFLSTLPARGATAAVRQAVEIILFLSTLPARGATCKVVDAPSDTSISIHAPREGSDRRAWAG